MKKILLITSIVFAIASTATAQNSESVTYFKSRPVQSWGVLTEYGGSNATLKQFGFVIDEATNDFILTICDATDTVTVSEKFFSWREVLPYLNAEHDRTDLLKATREKVWDVTKNIGTREARLRLYVLFTEISSNEFKKYARQDYKYCLGFFQMEGAVIIPIIRYEPDTKLWRISIEPAEHISSARTLFWRNE